jgi:hypothetical protein
MEKYENRFSPVLVVYIEDFIKPVFIKLYSLAFPKKETQRGQV